MRVGAWCRFGGRAGSHAHLDALRAGRRYLGGAISNSDADHDDISMVEMYARYAAWVAELSDDERHELFVGSAKRFYRI